MRLSLYLITALMHSDISYVHTHTQHARPSAKTSLNLLIPTAMSITHVSPTLQVCKVNIRDEQDRLSVEVHEGLEDGDVSTFVWGQHGHFDIRNCGNKDWDWGYWRLWWGPTSSKGTYTAEQGYSAVRVKAKSSCGKGSWNFGCLPLSWRSVLWGFVSQSSQSFLHLSNWAVPLCLDIN